MGHLPPTSVVVVGVRTGIVIIAHPSKATEVAHHAETPSAQICSHEASGDQLPTTAHVASTDSIQTTAATVPAMLTLALLAPLSAETSLSAKTSLPARALLSASTDTILGTLTHQVWSRSPQSIAVPLVPPMPLVPTIL